MDDPHGRRMGAAIHEVTAANARRGARSSLAWAPFLTVGALLLPIAAGFLGTLLPAFGYLPALGGAHFNLSPWRALVAYPGFATSVVTTLCIGIATSLLAVAVAVGFCAFASGRPRVARWLGARGGWLSPLLSTPHSAIAIGFAFLVAPSGWIARGVSPWLTGWTLPPDIATVGDATGWTLVLGLLLKEVPFLVLMIIVALHQVPVERSLAIARSLGYRRSHAWLKVVLPQIHPQLRLPIYAVIAFSLSVVDVALILGPANPPTLSVLAVRWFTDADIQSYFPAAAGAILQTLLVISVIALWFGAERCAAWAGRNWIARGDRRGLLAPAAGVAAALACGMFALAALATIAMGIWSFAAQWRFPDAWPQAWSLATWSRHLPELLAPFVNTMAIGVCATAIALVLVAACLENESRRHVRAGNAALWTLYVPLLIPQVAFLFGAQVLLVRLDFDGTFAAVVWAHLVFVLPYLFLVLAEPWRARDPRFARTAAGLGASRTRAFFRVKLPILSRPIAAACAIAFAVSVGQYLATLFAGNGRVPTLTTEAVTLAAGADRRVIGIYAFAQSTLPLLAYVAAAGLPAILFRNRRGITT